MNTFEAPIWLKRIAFGLTVSLSGLIATPAAANDIDNYPDRPIKLIVGFSPGGPTDVVARLIGEKLGAHLGQPVIIENRPGASGNIAASAVSRSSPDGYTAFYNTSTISTSPWIFPDAAIPPLEGFSPVSATVEMPLVVAVNGASDIHTIQDLIGALKDESNPQNYGSSGNGAPDHLAALTFLSTYQIGAQHVPYKGTAPALMGLLSGQTLFMITTMNTAIPLIKDGRLRALAVTSDQRVKNIPDVPTLAEALPPGFVASAWQGVVFPKGTPQPIIDRMQSALQHTLNDQEFIKAMDAQGLVIVGGATESYERFLATETERWGEIIAQSDMATN